MDYKKFFLNESIEFFFNKNENFYEFEINKKKKLILIGTIYALFYDNKCFKFRKNSTIEIIIKKIFAKKEISLITDFIEGSFIGLILEPRKNITIFSDKFNRKDIYYIYKKKKLTISTSIEPLIPKLKIIRYNQTALANILSVYGNYSPKKDTIYKDICKLGVSEYILCKKRNIKFIKIPFNPEIKKKYTFKELNEYSKIFRSSIEIRSSKNTNWVYMSSGWDSSAVLATLSDIYGPSKIRAVIGKFKYSKKSGVNNNFEIERAKKITSYFKVPLDIVEIDYTTHEYLKFWEKIKDNFKTNHLYALFSYNFFRLANHIKNCGSKKDAVFNGEISDGIHNLGFSQFASILDHPDLNFREYSDKMSSYLYGPSFFKRIKNDDYSKDVVFKLLSEYKNEKPLKTIKKYSEKNWKIKYIISFFLSLSRIPFSKTAASTILSHTGYKKYEKEISNKYFKEFSEKVNEKNLYAWLINLYNSFHWQSSTVKGMMLSPEFFGLQNSSPFWDSRIHKFLSAMPENWGRGLDFNKTKYPLKWMLENKIDYPNHLQTGPHSYLYDVDPSWSAHSDIIYSSAATKYFKKLVKDHPYEEVLDPSFFDLVYINKLVDEYVEGKIERGKKLSDLTSIISLCNVGWY